MLKLCSSQVRLYSTFSLIARSERRSLHLSWEVFQGTLTKSVAEVLRPELQNHFYPALSQMCVGKVLVALAGSVAKVSENTGL